MPRTIDQQIADAQAKLARLKTRQKASDTRRKIIVGATIIPAAFKDKKLARYLVRLLETSLTREVDKQDAEPLLDELRKFIGDDQA